MFQIDFEENPVYPDFPISISRGQFEAAVKLFADQGIPIKKNMDQAWLDFAGWRVNYDSVLTELSELTMAPTVIWI